MRDHKIRRSLRQQARIAAITVAAPNGGKLPDLTTPIEPQHDTTVREQIEALRSTPSSRLLCEVSNLWGDRVPSGWRRAADDPSCFLASLADASSDAWSAIGDYWQSAMPMLDREARKIGAAVVTGGLDVLLNSLHPRLRFAAGELAFTGSCNGSVDLGNRRLALVPMLAGPDKIIVNFGLPDIVYVGYPVSGQRVGGESPSAEDALSLVLGATRAEILRALVHPLSMSDLARSVHCAASTATYHCDQLAAAQLITRERRAQTTWVMRSSRAVEVIGLLSSPA